MTFLSGRVIARYPRATAALVAVIIILALPCIEAMAGIQLLAVTSQAPLGAGGVQYQGLSAATLNDSGEVAFLATLKPGVAGVDATNDRAVWSTDGASHRLLAQAGDSAPGGGLYEQFLSTSIDNAGEVVVRGGANGGQRIWRLPPLGSPSAIAATGVIGVPGEPLAKFETILPNIFHTSAGNVAYNAMLAPDGIVTFQNDRGVWLHSAGQGSLLVREMLSPVPGVSGAEFERPLAQAANEEGAVALLGAMFIDGDVSPATSVGVWRIGPTGGELVARRASGSVAGVPGASYSQFDGVTINNSGEIAFAGELELGGGITEENRRGVWISNGAIAELVIQSGAQPPEIPEAKFASFGSPLLSDSGSVLFEATLAPGVGGADANNADGLWRYDDGDAALLARTGAGGVPGIPGANFAGFTALAFNKNGAAAVNATLAVGAGGVTAANDQGLWLWNSTGGLLIARKGDALADRIVESLEFVAGSGGGDGRPRSLNNQDELVFKAMFTNGDEGLFHFSPDAPNGLAADFTLDGLVNAADLLRWKQNFRLISGAGRAKGDADADGDVDGRDFLAWQRQLGGSPSTTAIPEPSLAATLLSAGLIYSLRLRGSTSRRG